MRYVAASVVTDRQTDRQTDKPTAVTLAHAPRVKYKYCIPADLGLYSVNCKTPDPSLLPLKGLTIL